MQYKYDSSPYNIGPLELLIMQPTSFCNLNCTYCYIAEIARLNKARMTIETAEKAIERTMTSGLIDKKFTILWHAGEPLIIGHDWYRQVDALVQKHCKGVEVTHNFQSNATLVDDEWCDLLKSTKAQFGVSIDGPEHVHDMYRKTWSGKGTHAKVMKGVECLHRNDIPFHILVVVTKYFLNNYNEALDFFENIGATSVGFNVEELEINNKNTTMNGDMDTRQLYREFMRECYQRHMAKRIDIREVRQMVRQPQYKKMSLVQTQVNTPFRVITVGYDGGFSTFTPELHGVEIKPGERFIFGNVYENEYLDAFANPLFANVMSEIIDGYIECKKVCPFFKDCGGGTPSNKFFELGTMAGTETLCCDYRIKENITIIQDCMGLQPIVPDHPALMSAA